MAMAGDEGYKLKRPRNEPEKTGMDGPEGALAQPYEVRIVKAINGFVVGIGCATFVSQDWKNLSKALELYFENPVEARKKYYK